MKETKNYMKRYWWIIIVVIFTIGLPILLNFFVFKPASQLSVGTLQDWMAFWGSYLSATISAMVAFVILIIQRKDAKESYKQIRHDNQMLFFRERRFSELNEAIKSNRSEELCRQQQVNNILQKQSHIEPGFHSKYMLEDLYRELGNKKSAHRLKNALKYRNISTLEDFLSLTPGELLDLDNVDYDTLLHIKEALNRMGIVW